MKKNNIKKIIAILSVIILLILTFFVGKLIINEVNDPSIFKNKLDSLGIFGYIIFISISIIQVLLALIPSEAIEIAGGYAYGPIIGTILVLTGVTIGSIIVILLTKKYGKRFVNIFYDDKKIEEIKIFKDEKKLTKLIFILFLLPGTPKDLITYLVGLSKLKLSTYLILTTIARIPNILVSTLAGSALYEKDINKIGLFISLSVVSGIIGLLIYKFYISKKEDL